MPDGPEIPKSPEWTAWLAVWHEDLPPPGSQPGAETELPNGTSIVEPLSSSFFVGGCLLLVVWLAAVVRSIDLVLQAVQREEAELAPYLIAAHIPLLVGVILGIREFRRDLGKTTEARPEGFAGLLVVGKVTVAEQGIHLSATRFRGWERFKSFEYLGTERENWFRIRLHYHDTALFPSERSRCAFWKRLRAISGIALPPTLFLVSTVATIVVFLWGLHYHGWRHDVSSAFLASVAHLLVAITGAFAVRSNEADKERLKRRLSHMDLLFDSREATASDVLNRLERYLPQGKPQD